MIPDMAVEAAAKVLWDKELKSSWASAPDGFKVPYLRDARDALEAAAPHMEAEAYDLGLSVGYYLERGWVYEDALKMPVDRSGDNPYR